MNKLEQKINQFSSASSTQTLLNDSSEYSDDFLIN